MHVNVDKNIAASITILEFVCIRSHCCIPVFFMETFNFFADQVIMWSWNFHFMHTNIQMDSSALRHTAINLVNRILWAETMHLQRWIISFEFRVCLPRVFVIPGKSEILFPFKCLYYCAAANINQRSFCHLLVFFSIVQLFFLHWSWFFLSFD